MLVSQLLLLLLVLTAPALTTAAVTNVTFSVPPSGVAWRSWVSGRPMWGLFAPSSWSAASKQCAQRGGHLLGPLEPLDQQNLGNVLGATFWVGLTSNTSSGQPAWVGGSHWLPRLTATTTGGFWTRGALPANASEPWCSALLNPALHSSDGALAAVNCTARMPFLCGFPATVLAAPLEALGTLFTLPASLPSTRVLAVNASLTWREAGAWCSRRSGTLLDLSNANTASMVADLPLPSPLYPTTPPPAHRELWLGLVAGSCAALRFNQGLQCAWDGGGAGVYTGVLPSGQGAEVLVDSSLCTVLDPQDMGWAPGVSCVDTRLAVCQAAAASGWEGYSSRYDGWEYTLFSRPTPPSGALAVCRQHGAVLQPLGNAAEEALVASLASRWARGLPLLVDGGGAAGAGNSTTNASRCHLMGGRDPNDPMLFLPGVITAVACKGLQAAFVCRREVAGIHAASSDPLGSLVPPTTLAPTNSPAEAPAAASPPAAVEQTKLPIGVIFGITFAAALAIIVAITAPLLLLRGRRRRRRAAAAALLPSSAKGLLGKCDTFHPLDSGDTHPHSNPIRHGQASSPHTTQSTLDSFPFSTTQAPPSDSPPPSLSSPSDHDAATLRIVLDMDPDKDLRVFRDQKLGHGAFGAVYRGEYFGMPVAVKTLDVLSMTGLTSTSWSSAASSGTSAEVAAIKQELEILSRVQHPNVVKLYGGCLTPPNVLIVMELMEYNLAEYIKRAGKRLPLRTSLQLIRAVAAGLTHLHPSIIHRDLKPQNILLDSNGNVKISDFGVSRVKLATYLTTQHQAAGTIPYMAPECYSSEAVTEKFDIYSLGMIMWECLSGQPPWQGWNGMAIMYNVGCLKVRPPLPEDPAICPPDVADLITRCWSADPHARPSAEDIVNEINRIEALLPE